MAQRGHLPGIHPQLRGRERRGLGDVAGLRFRLRYLADLGVDALWINPWYPSPMADGGYDVSDHRALEPIFGTLAEAEALLREAHELGLRVLLDVVPNHSSDQHPWFQAALAAGPGSAERERYIFRPGRGDGSLPPNDWRSELGGPAWTRTALAGEWYLHLFAPEQPDLNWASPEVRADFESTLRFWFDRGVDGFRVDAAHMLVKQDGLPDVGGSGRHALGHPHRDRDEVHEVYRGWRRIADSYPEPRVFVAEAGVDRPERLAMYVRGDELHTTFNFDLLSSPWRAQDLRPLIERALAGHAAVGAPTAWVLSNHDVARHLSRYARAQTGRHLRTVDDLLGEPADLALGTRRARAAALLMLALPGVAYVYQGEELGLPEVEDLPTELLADPVWERSGRSLRGRDGCRVPLPWSGDEPPFGFSADGTEPWLPQPPAWRAHTVAALSGDPGSVLELYRTALRLRREHPALGDGTLRWLNATEGALAFAREPGLVCMVNLAGRPMELPAGTRVLLASGPLGERRALPPDTAAWLGVS